MATQGEWLGQWPGEWFGALQTNPNAMAAALYGGSAISASLTYESTEMVAALSGGSSLDATLSFAQSTAGGYGGEKKKKYVVKRGDTLLVFSNEADALNALPEPEVVTKQYPAKKGSKKPPTTAIEAPQEAKSVQPDTSINLDEIKRLASIYQQQAEYQRLLQQRQYEVLLSIYEKFKAEEEEDEYLLLMAA